MRRIMIVLVVGLLAGCGGGGDSEQAASVPTAQELASAVLSPEDLGEGWALMDPDAPLVVTEQTRETVPGLAYCPEADPQTVELAADLPWQAFTMLTGPTGPAQAMVAVTEQLVAGDPVEMADTFEALQAASAACAGVAWGDPSSPMVSEPMTVPEVGEDRFGEHSATEWLMQDPADSRGGFDIRQVVVLDGSVLMVLTESEAGQPLTETTVTAEQLDQMVTTAADRLPS